MIVLSHSSELQRKKFKNVKRFLQLVFSVTPATPSFFGFFQTGKGFIFKTRWHVFLVITGKKESPQHHNTTVEH
jgi:hypothetical protein